ncbi:MAG: extracellular solute-binding protein [Hyphomicrobiales bacterium]|nr:extracellular solute-binding protein [Hyphomicrobiales bacterium]
MRSAQQLQRVAWSMPVRLGPALAVIGIAFAGAAGAAELPPLVEGSDWLRQWDGVTLTLSSHTGPTTDAVAEIAQGFAAATGAEVEVIDESWTDLLSKHLADAAAGGGTYDILTWPYIWSGHYVEGGVVEDLNPWFANGDLADPNFDIDDIPEAIIEVYGRYRGSSSPNPDGLWSVPYKFDVYLAQYRTDLFEQAGIVDENGNAKPPETWAELLDNAATLKEAFPDMQPLVFPLAVDDPMVATFLPMLAAYGGAIPIPWYDANTYPEFQNKPGQDALAALQELTAYMPADVLDMDYDRVNAHMAQGLAAYALNWNAYLPVLLDPDASTIANVVAFDGTPGGPAGRFSGLGGWQMGVSSQSENREAAFQLLQWIAGRDRAVDLALAGGSVARFSVAEDAAVIEAFPYYPLLLDVLEGYAARGMDRSWAELQRTIGVGLSQILLGEDMNEGLIETAGQVFDQAQRAGYTPEATGERP